MKTPLTRTPCPSCLASTIRREAVQRLPKGAWAPLGPDKRPTCHDCAAAGTVLRVGLAPNWNAARICVANERQEQYRLPGVPMGLVMQGLVRPSEPGDFADQLAWLNTQAFWTAEETPDNG